MSTNDRYELIGGVLYNTPADETTSKIRSKNFRKAIAVGDKLLSAKTLESAIGIVSKLPQELVNYMNSPLIDVLLMKHIDGHIITWIECVFRADIYTVRYIWYKIYDDVIADLYNHFCIDTATRYGRLDILKYITTEKDLITNSERILQVAAQHGRVEIVAYMFNQIEVTDKIYKSTMQIAAEYNKVEVLQYLIETYKFKSISVNDTDDETCIILDDAYSAAIEIAVDHYQYDAVKYLLKFDRTNSGEKRLEENLLHSQNNSLSNRIVRIIKLMVESSPKYPDIIHGAFIYYATNTYNVNLINYLIDQGASVKYPNILNGVIKRNNFGLINRMINLGATLTSAWLYHIDNIDINLYNILFAQNVHNQESMRDGLAIAVKNDNLYVLNHLLEAGARFDLDRHQNLINYTIFADNYKMLRILTSHNLDITFHDLYNACSRGNMQIIENLFGHININVNEYPQLVREAAASDNNIKVLTYLLTVGLDINHEGIIYTILKRQDRPLLKWLLKKGIDTNLIVKAVPAFHQPNIHAIKYLLDAGINILRSTTIADKIREINDIYLHSGSYDYYVKNSCGDYHDPCAEECFGYGNRR